MDECSSLTIAADAPEAVVLAKLAAAEAAGAVVDWDSVLHNALVRADEAMAKRALAHHATASVGAVFDHCFPPKADHPETAKWLSLLHVVLGAAPAMATTTLPDTGDSLLHRAVERGSLPHLEWLLGTRRDPAAPAAPSLAADLRNAAGSTPLYVAVAKRYPCIIDALLAAGADPSAVNAKGNGPLAAACQTNDVRLAERLVTAGADCDAVNVNGDTVVHLAVRNNAPDVLALLARYADPRHLTRRAAIDGFCPLFSAVEMDHVACLDVLVQEGADPVPARLAADNEILPGGALLHLAAHYQCPRCAERLIALHADVDDTDAQGRTPLHIAAARGNAVLVRALVQAGCDTGAVSDAGLTAAQLGKGHPEVAAALLDPLLAPLKQFASGACAAPDAAACAALLRGEGGALAEPFAACPVDAPLHTDGRAALAVAAVAGSLETCEALIAAGADPQRRDRSGASPATWALLTKHRRLQALLPPTPKDSDLAAAVTAAGQASRADAAALFVGPRPRDAAPTNSARRRLHFHSRLGAFASAAVALAAAPERFASLTDAAAGSGIDAAMARDVGPDLWAAKVATVVATMAAAAAPPKAMASPLAPHERLALQVAGRSPSATLAISEALRALASEDEAAAAHRAAFDAAAVWYRAVQHLAPLVGECYMAADPGPEPTRALRAVLSPGAVVCCGDAAAATLSWQTALGAVGNFAKAGTVFILQSKGRAHVVGPHGPDPEHQEVAVAPGTSWRVVRWLRGDEIALGQPNIRTHTFELKTDADRAPYLTKAAPLIIELEEA